MSVKDYDPRLVQLWTEAALREKGIYLPFIEANMGDALKKATTQRHRMYRLRKEMEREKHSAADNAKKCKISTLVTLKSGKVISFGHRKTWDDDREIAKVELHLIAHAADTAMDAALAAAGFDVPEAPNLDFD